jgi:two-component system cell cycle sensor histidine kinase/response regulator CckA
MCELMPETPENASWCLGAGEETLRGGETILYVEDEAFVRDVTCEVLRSAGYRVITAKNAKEAMRYYDACRGQVELLLTDVVLPGETGFVLAGRLRGEDPDLKVLLVTGYGEQMGRRGAEHEECLAKPFSAEALLQSVRHLLDHGEVRLVAGALVTHACGSG